MPDNPESKNEAFRLRLTIGLLRRYRRPADFIPELERRGIVKGAAFYYHLSGRSQPKPEVMRQYERLLDVPEYWLERGAGESIGDLREAAEAMNERDFSHRSVIRIFTKAGMSPPGIVNQHLQDPGTHSGKYSQIRHIPILSDNQISDIVAGHAVIADLLARTAPVDIHTPAGPQAFFWSMPDTDFSMTSSDGLSFPPRTRFLVDPGAPVEPGQFVLVRAKAKAQWMLRRYQGAVALAEADHFKLAALNPSFEAIRVRKPTEAWVFAGRALSVTFDLP